MCCYSTLWNMSSRNCHAQELHEQTTTHARFRHWKLLFKNTHLMLCALCNSLTRRSATYRIIDCSQLPQQRRKTPQQDPFAHHQRSVTVSENVSWQVKIGLEQFDNYRSQVKINVKIVNKLTTATLKISGEFFAFQQDSAQTQTVRETISLILACNLAKCWLV